ncbi:RNA 2',3'-cyclic phosphodiesterase [Streptosporangium carneum]|uniref:RNA 2',3'-cyclic phosphodiesterase n=1 Tax=Streptosporangium carneum TaxID=47481 RepID=A0A9W6I3Z9_9ACTN|nr:RNA 2',3'-cyclic phosphodiesterase [Streptosporangium carneum]GLK11253.1 RNA 2',3'-cyclic phosphodiesterase [Streptosporangium carneum]
MRLFVGVLPPRHVLDELLGALRPHRAAWSGLRWIDRANWHVTLSFLGEVSQEVLPELETRLARAASRHAPMTLSLAGAGAFPSARRARVLWTGLYGPGLPLVRLAESLGAGARRAGAVQADRRQLKPHLTLARARPEADVSGLVEALGEFAGTPWEVDAVHLMRSHLGPAVRYEKIADYALTAPAPDRRS